MQKNSRLSNILVSNQQHDFQWFSFRSFLLQGTLAPFPPDTEYLGTRCCTNQFVTHVTIIQSIIRPWYLSFEGAKNNNRCWIKLRLIWSSAEIPKSWDMYSLFQIEIILLIYRFSRQSSQELSVFYLHFTPGSIALLRSQDRLWYSHKQSWVCSTPGGSLYFRTSASSLLSVIVP